MERANMSCFVPRCLLQLGAAVLIVELGAFDDDGIDCASDRADQQTRRCRRDRQYPARASHIARRLLIDQTLSDNNAMGNRDRVRSDSPASECIKIRIRLSAHARQECVPMGSDRTVQMSEPESGQPAGLWTCEGNGRDYYARDCERCLHI